MTRPVKPLHDMLNAIDGRCDRVRCSTEWHVGDDREPIRISTRKCSQLSDRQRQTNAGPVNADKLRGGTLRRSETPRHNENQSRSALE